MMMPRKYLVKGVVFSMLVAVSCRDGAPKSTQPSLRILCGSSMAQPIQEIGQQFAKTHGIDVIYDMGGAETLLPRVLADAPADVFVCHDPFEEKVNAGGKLAGSVAVACLKPVVLVRPGNPRQIRTIADLARAGLKIGIGDPKYSTCGAMFVQLLDQKGLREKIMGNATLQARTHTEIANGLIAGPLDAIVVWNFVAGLYKGKVQLVETDDAYPPVRITVLGLKQSPSSGVRDAFLEACRGAGAAEVFVRHGYSPLPR
jgi:molybdate transport system substrate-binding protein